MQSLARRVLHAELNFAASRGDGGIWSNAQPEIITQQLLAHDVEISDARLLPSPSSLEAEGFEVCRMALSGASWTDPQWIAQHYLPRACELVGELTGAAHVAPFYGGLTLTRDTGDPQSARAAEFVHLDQTRASVAPFLEMDASPEIRAKYRRVKIFNVWRPITPPPQDVPLALCDQRSLAESDWTIGRTVEPSFPDGVPYISSVFNPRQKWFYFSDLSLDEVIIFKGYDSDRTAPMGCLHGAFRNPHVPVGTIPRASVELRLFAFFEA